MPHEMTIHDELKMLADRHDGAGHEDDESSGCVFIRALAHIRGLDALITEQKHYSDHMRHQISDRLPGDIAERCDSWSSILSAVSRLKTERNNAMEEVERLKAQIESIRNVINRDHSATRFSEVCEIVAQAPAKSLADIQARAVEAILKDLRSDMPDTNTARRIFQRLQLRVDTLRHVHRVQVRSGSGYAREVLGQNNEGDTVTV